jgi:hypothetical protein
MDLSLSKTTYFSSKELWLAGKQEAPAKHQAVEIQGHAHAAYRLLKKKPGKGDPE